MTACNHYRQSMLADPRDPDPELREHRASCTDCNLFTERLLHFEARLDRALRVASAARADSDDRVVPLMARSARRAPANRRSWLALAASVLVAVVVAGGLWLSVPERSLAADVVIHMRGEPQAWRRTDVPVPSPALQQVLRDSSLHLAAGAGIVSYASSCDFRGRVVPHLVVQTESGPVTVMVLVHERAAKNMQFAEQGYRGVIVPVPGHGSLAILMQGPAADPATVEQLALRVVESIVWTG